jgi:hypothetical protein
VNPDDALAFVWGILGLAVEGVNPMDIVNGDDSAFLLYPHGLCTCARRGAVAAPIQTRGSERQPWSQ